MANGIRIDDLDATLLPSRDHVVPAMKEGLTVKLTVGQILDILGQVLDPDGVGSKALFAELNLSDLDDPEAARENIGLGNSATRDVGTTAGTVAAGDDSRIIGALQRSGGEMAGPISLPADPTEDLHAATKQYVDNKVAEIPAYGAVGSVIYGMIYNTGITENTLYSGSSIYPAGSTRQNTGDRGPDGVGSWIPAYGYGGSPLTGTWRALGRSMFESGEDRNRVTLFERVM